MLVKELVELLDPDTHGELPVYARFCANHEAPSHDQCCDVDHITYTLDPDTAEEVIVVECRYADDLGNRPDF